MVQMYQKGTSSPELASFVAATNSLVNAYVRAVSPTGVPTDAMREHAYEMLNSAQSPEAYSAVINTMKQEMQSALNAPEQVRKELRGQNKSSGNGPAPKITTIDGYKIMEH
jgi:cobalamin biosynthesis protein CobT